MQIYVLYIRKNLKFATQQTIDFTLRLKPHLVIVYPHLLQTDINYANTCKFNYAKEHVAATIC